ncbi:MAG: cyclase family protein [Ilumatobacteraceae bacterium]
MSDLPAYHELPRRGGLPASWGVWGDEGTDVFGCLNMLTPERIVEAARLGRRGAVFPLNWDMRLPDPPLFDRRPFEHEVTGGATGTSHDDVLHGWNTQSSSQWDGFRHIRNHAALADEPGTGHYGAVADDDHGMHHWARRGIVGRAVLADVGRWRDGIGRPLRHDESDPIEPEELAECLAAQGTELHEGDVLLVRTGWIGWYEAQPDDVRARLARTEHLRTPGLRSGERLAEVLWDLHIAALGCDNPAVEVWPPGALSTPEHEAEVRADRRRLHEIFTHTLLLPMLGLPLGEMWDLEALAADCAADGRYECFFTSAPINLPAGVASPPNALAIK